MKKVVKKQTEEVVISKVEEAKQFIEAEQKSKIELGTSKLNGLIKDWEENTGCTILIVGQFQGNKIQTGIQVILTPEVK